jgi:predicted transcriptional regulator
MSRKSIILSYMKQFKALKYRPETFMLYRISTDHQRRMDELAEKCNEGELSEKEYEEYLRLVQEAQLLSLENAKVFARFRNPELFDERGEFKKRVPHRQAKRARSSASRVGKD